MEELGGHKRDFLDNEDIHLLKYVQILASTNVGLEQPIFKKRVGLYASVKLSTQRGHTPQKYLSSRSLAVSFTLLH